MDEIGFDPFQVLSMDISMKPLPIEYQFPTFDVFSAASPQILPFHLTWATGKQQWFFYNTKTVDDRIATRNGYYQKFEHKIFCDNLNNEVSCIKKFGFYYRNPPHDIGSAWTITEYGFSPSHFCYEAQRFTAAYRGLCQVAKQTVAVQRPLRCPFAPSDRELMWFLRRNIMGLPIPDDHIPTYDVFSVSRPDYLPFGKGRRESLAIINTTAGSYRSVQHKAVFDENGTAVGFAHIMRFCLPTYCGRGHVETEWFVILYSIPPGEIADRADLYTSELILCKVVKDSL